MAADRALVGPREKSRPKTLNPRRSLHIERLALGLSVPLLLIIGWETVVRAGLVPAHQLPAPSSVLLWVSSQFADSRLASHIGITLGRVFAGFLLGAGSGLFLGVLTGLSRRLCWALDPLIQAFRSIPSLAWVPLFILWLGIGEESKIALIAVGVFFPVYLNVTAGLAGVDRKLVELAKVLGHSRSKLLLSIYLPAITPSIWTGLRGGLGLGWMFVVAAELLGASRGLGFLMEYGRNIARPEIIMASILLFAIIGKMSDGILALGESLSLRWRDSAQGDRNA